MSDFELEASGSEFESDDNSDAEVRIYIKTST